MRTKEWLSLQSEEIQMEFWKRFSHFLNNRELQSVMNGMSLGRDIMDCHNEIGAFEQYQLEVFKIIQTLSQIYGEEVVNPFL